MAKRRQQSRLCGTPRNTGPVITAGPVPPSTPKFCTHRPGIKCVQANVYPCRSNNHPCTSGCPSENCQNRGPKRAPTTPRVATKVSKSIKEAQETAPTFFNAILPVVFHQDTPAFSTSVILRVDE